MKRFLGLLVCLVACSRTAPPAPGAKAEPAAKAASADESGQPGQTEVTSAPVVLRGEANGVSYLERVTAGAAKDARLPLIVAIHGRGDRPESWVAWWDDFPVPARIILPRAPIPYGDGFSWFSYPAKSREAFDEGVKQAGDSVAGALAAIARTRPTLGKPIVTGFSQGGMLSFEIAARHPSEIAAAYPLSGGLPVTLIPDDHFDAGQAPPIVAVHGDADLVVPIRMSRDAVAKLRTLGFDVRLQEVPGGTHTVTPATRAEIGRLIAATARTQR